MPGPGHKQSRARVERQAAKAAARKPAKPREPAPKDDPKSPEVEPSALAAYLRNPTKKNEGLLHDAAARGSINTRDVAAALVAEIVDVTRLLKCKVEEVAVKRPLLTNRTRTLRALQEVVEQAPGGGGPALVCKIVWPAAFAGGDIGDEVVTRAPLGFE